MTTLRSASLALLLLLPGCSDTGAGSRSSAGGVGTSVNAVPVPLHVLAATTRAAGAAGPAAVVHLRWPWMDGAESFEIVRQAGAGQAVAIATSAIASYDDTGLAPNQTATYFVRGLSADKKVVRVTADQMVTAPTAEAAPSAGATPADSSLLERDAKPTFSWSAVPGATRYFLRVRRVTDDATVFSATTSETQVTYGQGTAAPFAQFPDVFPAKSLATLDRGLLYEWTVETLRFSAPGLPGGPEAVDAHSSPVYRFTIK